MRRRFHLPSAVAWRTDDAGLDRPALDRAILTALTLAVERASAGGGEVVRVQSGEPPRERFSSARLEAGRGTYRIPSYQDEGEPTEVPIESSEAEAGDEGFQFFGDDMVISSASPFEGRLVVILPGWRAVHVRSRPYVVTSNLVHAKAWGEILFGAGSFAILENLRNRELFVVATDEAVRWDELRTRPIAEVEGETLFAGPGRYFWQTEIPDLDGRSHRLRALVTVEGNVVFPPEQALAEEYFRQYRRDRRRGERLAPDAIRQLVFGEIDRLISEGNTEEAAERLAGLDANAFGLLPWEVKATYLRILIEAWTWEEQERAIVEVFRSMRSVSEVRAALEILRDEGRYDDLFDDLDSQLWSLLTAVGRLDRRPFTVEQLFDLLREAGLVPGPEEIAARLVLGPAGAVVTQDVLDEAEEAALSFVRFLGTTAESVWMFLSHPEKVVEGVAQLVRLSIAAQLAQVGHRPSIELIRSVAGQVGRQVVDALRGMEILQVTDRVARRVKWALVWEVASLFIGVGEVRAVLSSARVGELALVLTRLARILRVAGEAGESARVLRNLERVAAALARAQSSLGTTEDVLRLMSRLPEDDLRRLRPLLEAVDLDEGIDLARLAAAHPQLGEAATDLLARSEALSALAAKAGGLTDDVAGAFARLSEGGLQPREIRAIVDAIPEGEGARFLSALDRVPTALLPVDRARIRHLLELLAGDPRRMDVVINEGFHLASALHRRSGRSAGRFDEYLDALERLREALPADRRATEYRRLLDGLEMGDGAAWIRLESARRGGVGRTTLEGLEAVVVGDVRAEAGFQRLLRGRHDAVLDEIVEDILPHDPALAGQMLARIGSLSGEQTRGLAVLHRVSDALPSAITWGNVFDIPASSRGELLELIARVRPSLDDTDGLARVVGRALTGPGTNVQGTLGHLWAARTLQRRFPGSRMRLEVQVPGREIDIQLTTGGRTIDVEVKTVLRPEPNPRQIRRDLIRHVDDQFQDLLYLFEPGTGSLDRVRDAMIEALGHGDVLRALQARGISRATAEQWLRQRLAAGLLDSFDFQ